MSQELLRQFLPVYEPLPLYSVTLMSRTRKGVRFEGAQCLTSGVEAGYTNAGLLELFHGGFH